MLGWEAQLSVAIARSPLETAHALAASGLSVIPIKPDGSKSPAVAWGKFQSKIATPDEIELMFQRGVGVAIVAGEASGNLEVLDIEKGAPFDEFCELVKEHDPSLLDTLVHVATPSGGSHLFYRCGEIGGNQKLAMHLDENNRPKVDIETRGRGGYVLTIGSPVACHPAKKEYQLLRNRLTQIPTITPAQRTLLLDAARSFNRVVREAKVDQKPQSNGNGTGARPGDIFNAQTSWPEILDRHGWVAVPGGRGEETLWRRPGKDDGFSATTNYRGSGLLYVFSTNASPFDHETSYSRFAAYALLNHNGDYRAAAREIAQRFGMNEVRNHKSAEAAEREAIRQERPRDNETMPELEHLAIQEECGTREPLTTPATSLVGHYIESASAFLGIEDPPIRYLVNELLPEQTIALGHGEPRTRKTWSALELVIAVATGSPAFGMDRFSVSDPCPVLYLSQEDSARQVRLRVKRFLEGRGISSFPPTLHFAVHKGIDLENPEWQSRLIEDIRAFGFRLVAFDPIRRFSPNVDKGPAEVRNVTAFLRRICVETGASVYIVHHDVKPSAQGPDSRRRSQKASGGDWFAASECPIAFEPAGENRTLVIPEDYKFSADPEPFMFTIQEDSEKTWVRLIGEPATADQAQDLAIDEKVMSYITDHPGTSGNGIAKGIRGRREIVTDALHRLEQAERIDSMKDKNRVRWFQKGQAQ